MCVLYTQRAFQDFDNTQSIPAAIEYGVFYRYFDSVIHPRTHLKFMMLDQTLE